MARRMGEKTIMAAWKKEVDAARCQEKREAMRLEFLNMHGNVEPLQSFTIWPITSRRAKFNPVRARDEHRPE